MSEREDRQARLGLSCVVEPGDLRLREVLGRMAPAEVWARITAPGRDDAWSRRAAALDLPAVEASARRSGIRFLTPADAEWPEPLAGLAHGEPVQESGGVPVGVWVRGRGDLAALAGRAVAVVGSRASTAYGDRVASELGSGLAARGITVVSGGAFGIDAAAHRGALAEEGPTIAVLAGGLDELYPRAHVTLLERVADVGVLVSEVPPGGHPTRRRFLTRNRLIAALASGVVVVEAGLRSGARNTATWAATCQRAVMAVPGPVGNPTSATPHRLIRENEAVLVTGVEEVCEMVAPMGEDLLGRERQPRLLDVLSGEERAVYEALPGRGSRDTGELALASGVSIPAALAALEGLRGIGLVVAAPDGGWRLGAVQDRPLRAGERAGRPARG